MINQATNLPAERPARAPITTGGTVGALIPQDIEQAYRIASAFAGSGMVPSSFGNKPEACFVAIMAGAEVGLPPFQAIQSFAIINGRPSMWGDALVAVIRNQGFKMREWYEGEGEEMIARCEVTRPDNREVIPGEFSVADAKKAGLWTKAGPWQTSPKRMLKMRARAFAIRDGAADVLRGFQVTEETEDYQPITPGPDRSPPAPVSMRAKLADQAGKQGFDPAHVAAETGETTEQAAEEVIEAESIEPEVRADPVQEPEPEQEATVTADPVDGADDLIRQNAYDDGYAGEPIDAVLVMCEDEREAEIAHAAHAKGHQDRIEKEAAEHAASEAAVTEEPADIAGPAPAGVKYLLASDEPANDGKVALYENGEVFSRVPALSAAGKFSRYDAHPAPQEAPQAAEVDAPEETAPVADDAAQEASQDDLKPNGLYQELAAKESWLQIKPLLSALYGSAMFQGLSPEDQAATRAHLFGALLEMKDRTRDPVDWATDAAAFGLWLDHTAAGNDPDRASMIEGTFQALQATKAYMTRLTDDQKLGMERRVQAAVAKIKGR